MPLSFACIPPHEVVIRSGPIHDCYFRPSSVCSSIWRHIEPRTMVRDWTKPWVMYSWHSITSCGSCERFKRGLDMHWCMTPCSFWCRPLLSRRVGTPSSRRKPWGFDSWLSGWCGGNFEVTFLCKLFYNRIATFEKAIMAKITCRQEHFCRPLGL